MTRILFVFLLAGIAGIAKDSAHSSNWRAATESELKAVIPARAPVEKERIETEFRTASGITDGKGKFVAGVVLITAGYSADGKYSHFFLTQVSMKIGGFTLKPGDYVFGFGKNENSLTVKFYNAQTGSPVGTVEAGRANRIGRIESFHIYPPNEKALMQIGRFAFPYQMGE
jgi:hypothetical protein